MAQQGGEGLVFMPSAAAEEVIARCLAVAAEADRLCGVSDPESTPFASKYAARDLLDSAVRQLDAAAAVALVERRADAVVRLQQLSASLHAKIGTICWDCEEPQAAQQELEQACEFFLPGVVAAIHARTAAERDAVDATPMDAAQIDLHLDLQPLPLDRVADTMKTLNVLGILWAGRSCVHKALAYLLAAKTCYEQSVTNVSMAPAAREEIESCYTHNLFYLAQAYGHVKDAEMSSEFCRQTLQRQLVAGLGGLRAALDWVKNCAGIADYYLALGHYRSCSVALASAEQIFRSHVIDVLYRHADSERGRDVHVTVDSRSKPNFVSGNLNAAEQEAELHRRWAVLELQLLRTAHERLRALTDGEASSEAEIADDQRIEALLQRHSGECGEGKIAFFEGLPVAMPAAMARLAHPLTFDAARAIFLRSAARIDAAKKFYLLDGYVTDHVTLLQDYSKLYHYLASFEADLKRKLAMEIRRMDLLLPLLSSLNRVAYEVLHKQLSYELGETALQLVEIKLDKVRQREQTTSISEQSLKKAEASKCNEYSKIGLACFAHFTFLYAHNKDRGGDSCYAHFEKLPLHELVDKFCAQPDEGLISEEEVRPFLNANFLACRIMSKVIPTQTALPRPGAQHRAHYLVACLHRYEWLMRWAPRLCAHRGLQVEAVFGEELRICQDMVSLLPSKIDRMCYMGEEGLSL